MSDPISCSHGRRFCLECHKAGNPDIAKEALKFENRQMHPMTSEERLEESERNINYWKNQSEIKSRAFDISQAELTAERLRADTAVADANDAERELAALREELAELRQQHAEQSCVFCNNSGELLTKVKALQSSLTAAEQRNDDLIDVLKMFAENSDDRDVVEISRHQISLSQPTESGASE